YFFGAFLIYTAVKLAMEGQDEEAEFNENAVVRGLRRVLPLSAEYSGSALSVRESRRRLVTPLVIVIAAISVANVVFALDSIPAIFGLTQNVYLVFTATAFSLLGLRQLYFLIDGLLDRLVYLSYGLAAILALIGVKLVLHAMHQNNVPFINGGEHVTVIPEIPTWLSLVVILVTLLVTTVASLAKNRGAREQHVAGAVGSDATAAAVGEASRAVTGTEPSARHDGARSHRVPTDPQHR
ncbi:MAG TPA: TerC family protein, partial [Blastococcus sp.]